MVIYYNTFNNNKGTVFIKKKYAQKYHNDIYFNVSVGMVKQPAMEPSEFTMSHEDFPALPGVPASSAAAALNSTAVAGQATNTIGDTVSICTKLTSIHYIENIP
jgi:hypothetical protein